MKQSSLKQLPLKQLPFIIIAIMALSLLFAACGDDKSSDPNGNGDNTPVIQTVTICDQVWMVKNLDVDHYRNGEPIRQIVLASGWDEVENTHQGSWGYYETDSVNGGLYGRLYNWYAVNDPRGLAPEGWHIATDDEWKELEMCLGMSQEDADDFGERGTDEGGKLKTKGTQERGDGLWYSPNTYATNEIGFSALPGGEWNDNDKFIGVMRAGFWWTSTERDTKSAWFRSLDFFSPKIERYYFSKANAYSARCVKD